MYNIDHLLFSAYCVQLPILDALDKFGRRGLYRVHIGLGIWIGLEWKTKQLQLGN